jgi:hypothetical protein
MSKLEVMCDWGNCSKTMNGTGFKLMLTATNAGYIVGRKVFCCYEHGALWCQREHEKWQEHGRVKCK